MERVKRKLRIENDEKPSKRLKKGKQAATSTGRHKTALATEKQVVDTKKPCDTPPLLSGPNLDKEENSPAIVNNDLVPGVETSFEDTKDPGTAANDSLPSVEEKGPNSEDKWQAGEKILCFHGPLIYEAKIQQVEIQNGIPKYFIHYHGWNKNWDEWVPEARMLKYSHRNVVVQKELSRAHEVKERKKRAAKRKIQEEAAEAARNVASVNEVSGDSAVAGGSSCRTDHVFAVPKTPSPVPETPGARPRRKAGLRPQKREVIPPQLEGKVGVRTGKRAAVPIVLEKPPDNTVESEEVYKAKMEIKIKMPEELKSYIVDDWEQICKHKRLCVLPAKVTAEQLIQEYIRAKTANKSEAASKNNKEKAILEVTAGVREYFNVMLPNQLLYRQERAQYEECRSENPGMVPVRTYGAVHLLRLFTKLGEMLVYTPLSEKSVNLLLVYVNDLLVYMKRNASLIFSVSDYAAPAEEGAT